MLGRHSVLLLGLLGLVVTACGEDGEARGSGAGGAPSGATGGGVGAKLEGFAGGRASAGDGGGDASVSDGSNTGGSAGGGAEAGSGGRASTGGAANTGGLAITGGAANTGGRANVGGEANTGGRIDPGESGGSGGDEQGPAGDGGTAGGDAAGGVGVLGGGAGDGSGGGAAGDSGGEGARAGCKRGVAYGHHSEADLRALSVGVSWWYNWHFAPDSGLAAGGYRSLGVEYVPMIWGPGSDRSAAQSQIPDDAQVLLGFNEPNFGSQSDLSASDAAALWPEIERIADAHGLALASPAVNYCGGDCQDTDPFHYLHEFFTACSGCRVDYVAMHIYVGCAGSGENHAAWLIDHVERYKSEFELPLWLTEFACDDPADESEQIAFMEDAVAYLEAEPRIQRYAWFSGRADNMNHVDLLGADGELTELGRRYVTVPQNPDCGL